MDLLSQLERCKREGNAAFVARKYRAASAAYTSALALAPSPPPRELVSLLSVLRTNRGLCSKLLDEWEAAEADARCALELDRLNPKAHHLIGLALGQRGEWAAAVRALEAGLAMAQRQRRPPSLLREMEAAIALARHRTAARAAEAEGDADALLAAAVHGALAPEDAALGGDKAPPPAAADAATRARLAAIFAEREARRASRDIPQHLLCSITFDIMLHPVITPGGHSFERDAIERALASRKEDPISRTPLQLAQLVPNLALKAAVDAFLEAHPWAHPLLPAEERP